MSRSARLAVHAALLLAVLAVAWPLLTVGGLFHSDEGAALAQERLLDRTGEWTAPNPEPGLDPEMEALPLELSGRSDDGRWSPYVKHPTYIGALRGASTVAGGAGPVLVSVLGTVVAAAGAGALAGRVRPGSEVVALWLTGLATPLFFDAYLVQAHTAGAAAAAWAAVAVSNVIDARPRRIAMAGLAVVLVVVGGLVRTESLFIGLGLAAAVVVAGRFGPSVLALGAALAVAAVATWYLEPRWIVEPLAGDQLPAILSGRDVIQQGQGQLEAFRSTWLASSYSAGAATWFGSAGAAGVAVVALASRTRPALARVGMVLALSGYLALAASGDLVPGQLIACPALAGLLGLSSESVRSRTCQVLLIAWTAFSLAVILSQYENGGGANWGGRFFAVGLPLVASMAAVGWCEVVERLGPALRRPALAVAGIVTSALVILAAGSMTDERRAVDSLVDSMLEARSVGAGGEPLPLLATTGIATRFAWEHVDDGTWLTVDVDAIDRYASRLAAAGEDIALVSFQLDLDIDLLGRWFELDRRVSSSVAVLTPR